MMDNKRLPGAEGRGKCVELPGCLAHQGRQKLKTCLLCRCHAVCGNGGRVPPVFTGLAIETCPGRMNSVVVSCFPGLKLCLYAVCVNDFKCQQPKGQAWRALGHPVTTGTLRGLANHNLLWYSDNLLIIETWAKSSPVPGPGGLGLGIRLSMFHAMRLTGA